MTSMVTKIDEIVKTYQKYHDHNLETMHDIKVKRNTTS